MLKTIKYLVFIGTAVFLLSNRQFRDLVRNYVEIRKLKTLDSKLDAETARLKAEKERLLNTSDDYLERLARKDLNLVRKGELEFRFTPPIAQRAK